MNKKNQYVSFMLTPSISGLRVNKENLVTWASGIKSPIYVDNRMSLASFNIRDMIYSHQANYILEHNIPCNAILAAPTAGLHIGPSVAAKLGVPFVIIKAIDKDTNVAFEVIPIVKDFEGIDMVIASNPDAIPSGIMQANALKVPFAYIRASKKDHGLENDMEGYAGQTGNALLLDYFMEESSEEHARKVLGEFAKDLIIKEVKSMAISGSFIEYNLKDQHCVVLEDLFSTSESARKQVLAARNLGARVEHTMAFYDYELEESNKRVREVGLQKHAFITAKEFLDIAEELDPKIKEQRSRINQFLFDPRNWRKQQLFDQIMLKKTFFIIGLDTEMEKIPKHLRDWEDPQFEFNKQIVDATHHLCIGYKPNLAFYIAYGWEGVRSFFKTVEYIKTNYPEMLVIGDSKSGDIGNTSKMWAKGILNTMGCNAMTVAPYMGEDSITPFLDPNKWTIVLGLTSNKGSDDFQHFQDAAGQKLFHRVLRRTQDWAGSDSMMYVIGATHPEKFEEVRLIVPDHFLLVPGVGAQGGELKAVCKYGINRFCGLLVNSSRGIIFAGKGEDFAQKAAEAALTVQQEMEAILIEHGLLVSA